MQHDMLRSALCDRPDREWALWGWKGIRKACRTPIKDSQTLNQHSPSSHKHNYHSRV
ncbi:uncharacterized protein BDW43DRAFT_291871 [Aspergillus alliaceus]|uniref:uncharacterized protein n=1 Tax=Petromyces alliaceus TaxID=209559 RepID=UPI0012A6981D|nr:uncharacterized protein BDW43DRAFT_291871 [Aspergillus alliaceus]KAB8228255.1 hypothetical protein BDW43DRAFT_291871 [Aspergillus alliaceus]